MIITPIKTRIFLEWENLLDFIEEHISFCHSCVGRNLGRMQQDSGINPEWQKQLQILTGWQDLHEKQSLWELGLLSLDKLGTGSNSQWQELQEKQQDFSLWSKWQKPTLEDGDILVITSKIVALAESRTFLADSEEDKLEQIKNESSWYTKTKYVHLTIHDRMPMANAGIDESNGDGKCILLPKNSYDTAYRLWSAIRERYHIKNLGIIITDSRTIPFRNGTTWVSLGHAGFEGIRDYVGRTDIFGRTFHYARTNVPDALATAAVHTMGEGDECQPLAIIKNPHCEWSEEKQTGDDLIIDPEDDMYGPLFIVV